ncbi:2,4-dichlorophenol 6-monooxygenase [Viridothelium virens]|uniref:2,4-dichlorophenol 6-monooxygenase n=1 Tax=Viridothelium virens TaxID=1048519 RepID=A0A6A6H3F7_VIRVR|nr:2,4-dichlorophenol 6-monooxygenase [Viridothelium virens]
MPPQPPSPEQTPVLIIGGSLVGLSTAMFLASAHSPTPIQPILIERHSGHSLHPRAIGYTPRTMEIFGAAGIADQIPAAEKVFHEVRRARIESLAGKWYEETSWTPKEEGGEAEGGGEEFSPTKGAAVAQDVLEPILRRRAVELGASVRFGTKLLGFEQDGEGVMAKVVDAEGREYSIRAQYMVAADGGRSQVREILGIQRTGRERLSVKRSVLFRADLQQYLENGISQFTIDRLREFQNIFFTTYGDGRWVLMFDDEEEDEDVNERELRKCIETAIGRSDIPIEIITTGRWEINGLVAEKFHIGRIFLAGDAAHSLPPSRGGYGVNTGIHDAHNLAWKLASVISKVSRPALLDTYDAERRPVALLRYQQHFARRDYADTDGKKSPILEDSAIELGQLYRSSAVLGVGDDLPVAQRPDYWKGQPGTRTPHLKITQNGQSTSSIDLFKFNWTLIAEDERWAAAAADVELAIRSKVAFVRVGQDVEFSSRAAFHDAFGVGPSGASLVRPDGYVAWRVSEAPESPTKELVGALREVASSAKH